MEELRKLLVECLNIDFLGATLSNPKSKDGITKIKVRPLLKKGNLIFQCELFKNNQAFHENYEAEDAVNALSAHMEAFKQMQLETKKVKATVLVSKKGKVTIQKKKQNDCCSFWKTGKFPKETS